jgi:hypothetical protein
MQALGSLSQGCQLVTPGLAQWSRSESTRLDGTNLALCLSESEEIAGVWAPWSEMGSSQPTDSSSLYMLFYAFYVLWARESLIGNERSALTKFLQCFSGTFSRAYRIS